MRLDDAAEAELEELVARLDRLVPKDAAHLTIPAAPDGRATVGSRSGYLRFGVEMLSAALRPLPDSGELPPRIEPRLESLLTEGSRSPFELCEIDESIASRPPVASRLGVLGQLGAGVVVVAAIVLLFLAASLVWRWVFG
jgi:hypothetical protein